MAIDELWIIIQIPMGGKAVGMHDEQTVIIPGIGEFLQLARLIAGSTVLRNEILFNSTANYTTINIADAGICNDLFCMIDLRHGDHRAARAAQTGMQRRDNSLHCCRPVFSEERHRLRGCQSCI